MTGPVTTDPGVTRRKWADVLGVAAVVVAVLAVLAPSLRPGVSLGPFDLLSKIGLTKRPGTSFHDAFPADQILYFLPMTNLAWHQVHSGHLPLWNPYNVLGTPLAFNWQSGVLSVPTLVSYLVPLRYVYTVIVLVKLIIAGTGAYFLCRVLRLGPMPSAFGGIAFELAGPMVHYSGWAMTSVTAWSGWILGFGILLVRGRRRTRDGALLALVAAAAVYGGHPESILVLGLSSVVFFVVFVLATGMRSWASLRRPVVDLGLSGVAAFGLAAPLILPGVQVAGLSSRAGASGGAAFGLSHLSDLAVALPGTDFRVPAPYLGVLTIVLAALALRVAWRRAEVLALGVMALVALILCFHTPLYAVIDGLPKIKAITWNREAMLLALAVAVLGAVGLEELLGDDKRRQHLGFALRALLVVGVIVALVGVLVATGAIHEHGGRGGAFVWPAIEIAGGLGILLLLLRLERPDATSGPSRARRGALGALVVLQAAALVGSGVSFWSLSSSYFPTTPAVTALQRTVGDALVARGSCQPLPFTVDPGAETGIRPNANIAYGIRQFAVYEPILPHAYYRSWAAVSGQHFPGYLQRVGVFCPVVTTSAQARVYGVSYVLTAAGQNGPSGSVRVGTIGGQELYRIPGAAEATLVDRAGTGAKVPTEAPGTPVVVHHRDDASWTMKVDASSPKLLRLRLTALPGWHASVDGHSVPLRKWADGALYELSVGPGPHSVVLHYWPPLLSVGLGLAVVAALALIAVNAAATRARRDDAPA